MSKRSLISINDISNEEILFLLDIAGKIQNSPQNFIDFAKNKILSLLFFEPSTRTYFSFSSGMYRLGGNVLGFSQLGATSVAKGESLEDTVRMMAAYSDIMVMRYAEIGSMQRVHNIIDIPLINAGEGVGEHPTQTLTDLFTIYKNLKKFDITIGLYGDLKYSRPNHSLLLAASRLGARLVCIAPDELQMPSTYIEQAKQNGAEVIITNDSKKYLKEIDVLYVSRLQKERLPETLSYANLKYTYMVDQKVVDCLKDTAIILHPLPRVGEIDIAIDQDPRAKYFEQAANGVAMRMAIIMFYLDGNN